MPGNPLAIGQLMVDQVAKDLRLDQLDEVLQGVASHPLPPRMRRQQALRLAGSQRLREAGLRPQTAKSALAHNTSAIRRKT